MRVLLIVFAFFYSSPFLVAQDNPVLSELEKAKKTYDARYESIRKRVEEHLDDAEDKARKRKDVGKLKTIERERADFENSNILPETTPKKMLNENKFAIETMEKAYKEADNRLLKSEDLKVAKEIEEEKKLFLDSAFKIPDPARLLTIGSVWKGKNQNGTNVKYECTHRNGNSAEIQTASINGKGIIFVEFDIAEGSLTVTRVGYRGPGARADHDWKGEGTIKGESLKLNFSASTIINGKNMGRWSASVNLSRD